MNWQEKYEELERRITQLADEWDALDMGTGLYPEDSAHREAHESRSQQCADDLRRLIQSDTGGRFCCCGDGEAIGDETPGPCYTDAAGFHVHRPVPDTGGTNG